jgi:S-DNA-T family DNA segregation ATPase FtsK/SpoIIIE
MKLLSPTQHKRLNEVTGFLLLSTGLVLLLSLVSYHAQDPSWDTAAESHPLNLVGFPGAYLSDIFLQTFGAVAFLFPLLTFVLSWKWIRSEEVVAGGAKMFGSALLTLSAAAALGFLPFRLFGGTVQPGGALGLVLAHELVNALNPAGALLATWTVTIVSIYLVSSFTVEKLAGWWGGIAEWFGARRDAWLKRRALKAKARAEARAAKTAARAEKTAQRKKRDQAPGAGDQAAAETAMPAAIVRKSDAAAPPWETQETAAAASDEEGEFSYATVEEIPICPLEPESEAQFTAPVPQPPAPNPQSPAPARRTFFRLPSTDLLNEPPGRNPYDEQELKDTAARIKAKFEEFNVLGNVVQINPGPVVTTFEFKPEAGIKYSRITNLTEDLCLGLQAESILIERIPGKPTVGIEVPNTRRELIALRQMLESDEFRGSPSHLTIPLGKDINGRIKVSGLESMPHLLIAGSTGSGKSVMINSMIMGILYKATPEDVRMIMVDPKRVELGMYEGIPHLLTPVITDPRKATNALRNAVLEMERRLRLLAEWGVRNIDQYNKKVRQMQEQPRDLFSEEQTAEDPKPLPYVMILIDELADLMMLEGKNVEESVTRLAQMARAVGMHLVLATQRPSVDVITGLIKANFPARISFRVATRVDSRTILDVMGAEHLLGKGDMLFLPPGSSRLTRVHGAFVTETEISRVVDFWKEQAAPEYDQSFLVAPPNEEEEGGETEISNEEQDPAYEDAVRLVLQMGKASTSTLQRHLRLGYGRAARILDMMQRDGIIGPPDGSKPRDVLKRPDWLREVEDQLR